MGTRRVQSGRLWDFPPTAKNRTAFCPIFHLIVGSWREREREGRGRRERRREETGRSEGGRGERPEERARESAETARCLSAAVWACQVAGATDVASARASALCLAFSWKCQLCGRVRERHGCWGVARLLVSEF